MKEKKSVVRIICLILVILMAVTTIVPVFYSAFAETPAEKLSRLRKELQAQKEENESLQNSIDKNQQTKTYYQQLLTSVTAQIETQKELIATQEEYIAAKQDEIAQKVLDVAYAKDMFENRLKGMYEMSRQSNLSVLLGISDFSEMLRFAENLNCISKSDTELIENLRTQQAELEAQGAELQAELDELQAQKDELDTLSATYSGTVQSLQASISQQEADLEAKEAVYEDLAAQVEAAQKEWEAWAASITNNNYLLGNGLGEFDWPIPGYTYLSSDFGTTRYIYGVKDVHRGMDIPAPLGTPIYAAADGIVSTKAHWSYGTCVKISHSSSLVTIYGHMSARAAGITDGALVTKGQLIGYVGSTGNSTGNHLHFEVNLNGSPVSAWPYLNG
jgi:murein DD-endopeptidase MepM/ murein hydrolase activator NlpD